MTDVFLERVWPRLKIAHNEVFAPDAVQAIMFAHDEARQFGHPYCGSEHLFAGAMRAGGDQVGWLRRVVDVDRAIDDAMRVSSTKVCPGLAELEAARAARRAPSSIVAARVAARFESDWIRFTPRAKRNIESAADVARTAGGACDAELLLLAVMVDRGGVIASVVRDQHVTIDAVEARLRARREWGPFLSLLREAEAGGAEDT